jgi:putative protease
MMLDADDADYKKVLPEAKNVLSRALGRKWSLPFRDESSFKGVIHHRGMGTSGRLIGRVVRTHRNGFTAKLSAPLYLYDTLRIQPESGDEGPGLVVTCMQVGGRDVRRAASGAECRIACDKSVEQGARLFKTGSQVTVNEARVEALPAEGIALDIHVSVGNDSVSVDVPLLSKSWSAELDIQPARRHALSCAGVETEFRRSGDSGFCVGNISIDIEDGIFVPASLLKSARRGFWEWCVSEIGPDTVKSMYQSRLAKVAVDLVSSAKDEDADIADETIVFSRYSQPPVIKGAVAAHSVYDIGPHTDEAVLPDFCAEGALPELRKVVNAALKTGIRRFRVTSLYGLEILREAADVNELLITASYPLPVCNSAAFMMLRDYGVDRASAWVELGRGSLNDLLAAAGTACEVITYARLPLLSTRMEIPVDGVIRDSRGAGFIVKRNHGLTLLLPEKVFSIEAPQGFRRFIDLTHAGWGEDATSEFNFPRDLV